MSKLDQETQKRLDDKIHEVLGDIHQVMKKYGLDDVAVTHINFGPHIPGSPCSPPPGGAWTYVPGPGGYQLVCQ